ncbi:ABC transporter permease [Actinoplanes sp. NPDC048791]|uniref:ABC transporter permease n=1 Tax=Actinoplanes sp. NPDC048791 TaxID=3154623 RepID=UPI0033C121B8
MRRALHAEWTKLRTTPGMVLLLLSVVVATVGISILAAAATDCPAGICAVDITKVSLTGVQLGQAVVAVLAVQLIGAEYGTGMIHVSLAAVPRRLTVLAAKALVLTAVVTAAATAGVAGSLMAGNRLLPLTVADATVLRAAFGSVLYLVLIGLLALGVTAAVRTPATAAGLVLGLLYVFPIVGLAATDPDFRRHLDQIAPMTAGLAIQSTTGLDGLAISPWRGLAVLGAWAAAALLAGGLLIRLRDA